MTRDPYSSELTPKGRRLEDAAILRRLAREAEDVLSRNSFAARIERVPEHLRCAAYGLDGRDA